MALSINLGKESKIIHWLDLEWIRGSVNKVAFNHDRDRRLGFQYRCKIVSVLEFHSDSSRRGMTYSKIPRTAIIKTKWKQHKWACLYIHTLKLKTASHTEMSPSILRWSFSTYLTKANLCQHIKSFNFTIFMLKTSGFWCFLWEFYCCRKASYTETLKTLH